MNWIKRLTVFVIAGILLFLTFNRHQAGNFNYHSEIWADKAGYYVYLPAFFKYGFDAKAFPKDVDVKTGTGFHLDTTNGKVATKYTCGVAILQMPFYLLADILAPVFGMQADGFSEIYNWSVNLAAVFYLLAGFLFLRLFLLPRFKPFAVHLGLVVIFLGTNLYFFSIDETGMSHVYSFSLFCALLYYLQTTQFLLHVNWKQLFLLGLMMGLIILIRPTNILFLSLYLFLDISNGAEIKQRFTRVLKPKVLIPVVIGVGLILLPQLLYWNYLHGQFLVYSYDKEGFNWTDPQILSTWFAPNNGLFLYTPLFFLVVVGLIIMIVQKQHNGVIILSLFLVLSYVLSCWWKWSFGCSFGARNYVEYLSIFSVPLVFLFEKMRLTKWHKSLIVWCLVGLFVVMNLKMTYSFDECFHGNECETEECDWDWQAYRELVFSKPK